MKTQRDFTTTLLGQLNALVAGLSDDEIEAIVAGRVSLSLSLYAAEKKTKSLTTAGKKPKAVAIPPSTNELAERVRDCPTRAGARALITQFKLKNADLKEVLTALGQIPRGKTKGDLETQIVEFAGRHADSAAIRG